MNIPLSELAFSFSRSSGAGGQNVNKLETKVTVRWAFQHSSALSEFQKQLIAKKLKNRINDAGEITVSSQVERSQSQNRERAIAVLNELVSRALTVPRKRKKTKVPRWAKESRLAGKRRRAEKKELRRRIF